jgi:hypothetical protein
MERTLAGVAKVLAIAGAIGAVVGGCVGFASGMALLPRAENLDMASAAQLAPLVLAFFSLVSGASIGVIAGLIGLVFNPTWGTPPPPPRPKLANKDARRK